MKAFGRSLTDKLKSIDYLMLLFALSLSCISVVTLAAVGVSRTKIIVQIAAVLLGLFAMYFISLMDYQEICDRLSLPLFIISVGALALTLVIGSSGEYGGGKSWIEIPGLPFNIQPSEFVKVFFIITFAKHLDRLKDNINSPKSVLQLFLHAGIITGLVLIQGDLGTALVYFAIILAMLFSAGLSLWYFLGLLVAAVVATPIIWPHLGEFRQMRILCGFDPNLDPLGYGYQALTSLSAISAGGFSGKGFSGGEIYRSVPTNYTDFIFASIGEKFGFIGAFLVVLLLCLLVVRIIFIARGARKDYSAFMCIGIAAVFIAQTAENVGMCLASLPVVGITLPFVSYGGSSTLSLYMMLGVLQSIYVHRRKYYFERELS